MLKPKEIGDIGLILWYLPLEKVAEVKQQLLALKQQCGYKEPIDDSDEWTEEDRQDFARASAQYADESMPWQPAEQPEIAAATAAPGSLPHAAVPGGGKSE
jgi:hypothetical protein